MVNVDSIEIQKFVDGMSNRRQTILFSATEEKSQRQLINNLLDNPKALTFIN